MILNVLFRSFDVGFSFMNFFLDDDWDLFESLSAELFFSHSRGAVVFYFSRDFFEFFFADFYFSVSFILVSSLSA